MNTSSSGSVDEPRSLGDAAQEEKIEAAKQAAAATVHRDSERLIRLSTELHADPETRWQEHRSAARVAAALSEAGFTITTPYLGFDTAFLATYGDGPFALGLCAEYDALPGLGHACGHNLISAITVGAARALAPLAADAGLSIAVYGTPAEEGGGGKIELLERGAFTGLDLAMMAHPAPVDVAQAQPFAVSHAKISYTGKAAHAAAYPEQGVNAADAFTIAQVAIGLLRQQLPAGVRVHGVVTNGGEAPNAIPQHTEGRWYVRAESMEQLAQTEERVHRCFEAGSHATGASLHIEPESKPYSDFRTYQPALDAYIANAERLGRVFEPDSLAGRMNRASTDMGNVSQHVPAIHPYIGVGSWPVVNHQAEFADACIGPAADQAILDAATALAWTALDLAPHP